MRIDFVLKLFKEIVARWIEDLSSTKARQIESFEMLSRFCRRQKHSMDQKAIEKLSTKQKLSQWIENLSRNYQEKFQKASMDQRCIKICQEKKSKGLDRQLSVKICREVVELDKKQFFKERKNTEMNAIKQATQPKTQTTF